MNAHRRLFEAIRYSKLHNKTLQNNEEFVTVAIFDIIYKFHITCRLHIRIHFIFIL